MSSVLVRLKPYDRKRKQVVRQYTIFGMRFKESRGWYEVDKEVARMLEPLQQPATGDTPADLMPKLFDIMTHDGAAALEEAQRRRQEERAKAIRPHKMRATRTAKKAVTKRKSNDLSTDDLYGSGDSDDDDLDLSAFGDPLADDDDGSASAEDKIVAPPAKPVNRKRKSRRGT